MRSWQFSGLLFQVVSLACAVSIGFILLVFGVAKAGSSGSTLIALARVIPENFVTVTYFGLIAVELTLGGLLLAGWRPAKMLGCATALGVGFLAWITWLAISAPGADCGCGGLKWLTLGFDGTRGSLLRAALFFSVCALRLVGQTTIRSHGAGALRSSI